MQALLETMLASVYQSGWILDWQAVGRRLNTEADSLDTRGLHWAARLAQAEVRQVRQWIQHYSPLDGRIDCPMERPNPDDA